MGFHTMTFKKIFLFIIAFQIFGLSTKAFCTPEEDEPSSLFSRVTAIPVKWVKEHPRTVMLAATAVAAATSYLTYMWMETSDDVPDGEENCIAYTNRLMNPARDYYDIVVQLVDGQICSFEKLMQDIYGGSFRINYDIGSDHFQTDLYKPSTFFPPMDPEIDVCEEFPNDSSNMHLSSSLRFITKLLEPLENLVSQGAHWVTIHVPSSSHWYGEDTYIKICVYNAPMN